MIHKIAILFVDDEVPVLTAIERQLRRERERWDMVFAVGGQRALDEIHQRCFTVIVSDLRMPHIDGVAVLTRAATICPATVSIMLSGDAEADVVSRTLPMLYQLISKPCDGATLRKVIERAIAAAPVAGSGRRA